MLRYYCTLDGGNDGPVSLGGLPFSWSWGKFEIVADVSIDGIHDEPSGVALYEKNFAMFDPAVEAVSSAVVFSALKKMLLCFNGFIAGFAEWRLA